MNARRATWLLLIGVVVFCLGVTEVALRVMFQESKFLDPAENELWFYALRGQGKNLTNEGRDVTYDPYLGWRMRSSFTKGDVHTNATGMRGSRDYSVERVEGKKRILILGDSFTYGLGVADADVYGKILEAAHEDLEVLICATNSWGTDQMFLEFKQYRHVYNPDLVVIGIFEDDFMRAGVKAREYLKPKFEVHGDELVLTGVPVPPIEQFDRSMAPLNSRPRIVDAADYAYKLIRFNNTGRHMDDDRFEEMSAINRLLLRDLKKLTSELPGSPPLVVLTWPSIHYERAWDSVRIRESIRDAAKGLDLAVYDLDAQLRAKAETTGGPVYLREHSHWNRAGHEVAAQQLEEHLQKIGFFAP